MYDRPFKNWAGFGVEQTALAVCGRPIELLIGKLLPMSRALFKQYVRVCGSDTLLEPLLIVRGVTTENYIS
jgi:hypothetical protein